MIDVPDFKAHREWLLIKEETPMFWRLMMTVACHRCNHSPITPVDDHDDFAHQYDTDLGMFWAWGTRVVGVVGEDDSRVKEIAAW